MGSLCVGSLPCPATPAMDILCMKGGYDEDLRHCSDRSWSHHWMWRSRLYRRPQCHPWRLLDGHRRCAGRSCPEGVGMLYFAAFTVGFILGGIAVLHTFRKEILSDKKDDLPIHYCCCSRR